MIKVLITRKSGYGEAFDLTLKEFQEKFNSANGWFDLVEALGGNKIEFIVE